MKHKLTAAAAVLAVLLLSALYLLAASAETMRYGGLLLADPVKAGTGAIHTDKLEEFCEEEFLVTYEIRQGTSARAANSSHAATVIGTNACYPSVLGYVMLDGGFFTKSAWEAKERHATLNETAAFQLFGGTNISGQTLRMGSEAWLVTGVVQDGDEDNANIYAPSSVTGGSPRALMALLGATVNEAHAKNALKSLGVHDTPYNFYNLSKLAARYGEYFSAAWKSAACLLLIFIAVKAAVRAAGGVRGIKIRLRERYFAEVATKDYVLLLKPAGYAFSAAASIAGALAVSVQILELCLNWSEMPAVTNITPPDFAQRLVWLQDYHWVGTALFAAYICSAVVLFALSFARRSGNIQTGTAIKHAGLTKTQGI